MAYLYRKNRSPYWYIQYLDSESIKHDKSTGLRADDPNDTAKAKTMRAELEANEHRKIPLINGAAWDNWVLKYFERHCQSPRTLQRYTGNWKWLALWLQLRRLHSPRAITYRNALDYLDWRTTFKKKTGKIVGRNTAIMEMKLLAMIMGEAVRLGFADANPLVSLALPGLRSETRNRRQCLMWFAAPGHRTGRGAEALPLLPLPPASRLRSRSERRLSCSARLKAAVARRHSAENRQVNQQIYLTSPNRYMRDWPSGIRRSKSEKRQDVL